MHENQTVDTFLKGFCSDLPSFVEYDYIKKSQASFIEEKKNNLKDGEFVVCLDYSENYTCQIQDAIQSYHWASKQATRHSYVIDYRKNYKEHHDAASVNLFNAHMIKYLKSLFGPENVEKIYYFSDGAASQYKNKYNFKNLVYHEKDFTVKAK